MAKKIIFHACTIKTLSEADLIAAAAEAVKINPANAPAIMPYAEDGQEKPLPPAMLAALTAKYWGAGGVSLTVSFMESVSAAVRDRILLHANAWGEFSNVKFTQVQSGGQVRITLRGGGYWSYLGTDVLQIPKNQPTMSLEGFTANTSESEYKRVVRHEFGHTLSFPHEHMRSAIVNRLDATKTIAWGRTRLGWDRQTVIDQILTPLEESQIIGTPQADETSIMAYQLPASITKDGKPVSGGSDINAVDRAFAQKLYPGGTTPPPPPTGGELVIRVQGQNLTYRVEPLA